MAPIQKKNILKNPGLKGGPLKMIVKNSSIKDKRSKNIIKNPPLMKHSRTII